MSHCDDFTQSSVFSDNEVDVYYDYELTPGTRRPRILVQTAGHVAGAAYFYQQSNISADALESADESSKVR